MKIDLNNPISFACDAIAEALIPDESESSQKGVSSILHDILDHEWLSSDPELQQELISSVARSLDIEVIEKDELLDGAEDEEETPGVATE